MQVDARDIGSIPGEENVNPLQYSCLENSVDRGTWWATLHRVAKSWTTEHTACSLNKSLSSQIKTINN